MSKGRLDEGYDTGYGTEDDVVVEVAVEEEEEMGEEGNEAPDGTGDLDEVEIATNGGYVRAA